jgi:signal transduction histidine kinase
MRRGSIRLRLWSAAAISIVIALAVAGVGLRYLFERHVERRVESELTVDLNRLIGATSLAADGSLQVAPVLTDPRFETPVSGYYWQVEALGTGTLTRSRSLWEIALRLPEKNGNGAARLDEIDGPEGARLIAVERTIIDSGGSFRAVVAEDYRTVEASVSEYVRELAPALAFLAVTLIVAIFVQITVGLAPLEKLRVSVRDVVARRAGRLNESAPSEVRPLANEINRLLEAQEKALARARSRATDLAHGLKTPLQVLSADIRVLRQRGESVLADEIEKSAGAIRRHIERELTRARLAPGVSGKTESHVAEIAARVIAVVRRTPGGERLAFTIDAADTFAAPIDEGDLTEILGNLIENAARLAASSLRVEAHSVADGTMISVVDDGPGIPDADKEAVLSRGVRLDTKSDGSGLGLAIVSDIVDAYGGLLTIADATPGLKVTVFLPKYS